MASKKPEIMEDLYRKSLLKTVDYLIEVRHNLFSNAVDIAMNHELNEKEKLNALTDIYELQIEHSEKSSVVNLQKICDLIKALEIAVDSITEINNIDDSELGQER